MSTTNVYLLTCTSVFLIVPMAEIVAVAAAQFHGGCLKSRGYAERYFDILSEKGKKGETRKLAGRSAEVGSQNELKKWTTG